jgi:hypothetical protein
MFNQKKKEISLLCRRWVLFQCRKKLVQLQEVWSGLFVSDCSLILLWRCYIRLRYGGCGWVGQRGPGPAGPLIDQVRHFDYSLYNSLRLWYIFIFPFFFPLFPFVVGQLLGRRRQHGKRREEKDVPCSNWITSESFQIDSTAINNYRGEKVYYTHI